MPERDGESPADLIHKASQELAEAVGQVLEAYVAYSGDEGNVHRKAKERLADALAAYALTTSNRTRR